MDNNTVIVLANPNEPQLAMLEALPPETGITVGNNTEAFRRTAADASVIFNWSGSGALLRRCSGCVPPYAGCTAGPPAWTICCRPELVAHPVPLTNGSGVFSPPLGEFVLGAVLYFAKDFRRLIRNQMAGVWEPFDVAEVSGQTAGIVGYGDIGRACATRLKAMGMKVLALRRTPPSGSTDRWSTSITAPAV
ncbi:MAG: NAD(P)-dependent oxidoreductase [Ignavibacteriota bacterium]